VLAGGQATRFGGKPKGLEQVGGRRILDRVVEELAAAIREPPLLVANAPDSQVWRDDLRTVPDRRPGRGSLGGIFTAVMEADGPVLCVAWDMPFADRHLLRDLAAGAEGWDAFLPESGGPRGVEPLCAVYGPACRQPIADQLGTDDLRVVGFHPKVRVGRLTLDRVRGYGDPNELFFNVNTTDDLLRARALWERRASFQS
jgi:molybdopterin-guanine dinucleotide biosynthesis protein A